MDSETHHQPIDRAPHDGADREPASPGGGGGDPVCWLHLVCPECGRIADQAPPVTCARCGARIED